MSELSTRCEGCGGLCKVGPEASSYVQAVPGVRFPARPNEDGDLAWIERCDTCEVYDGDGEAAEALVEAGAIEGFSWLCPDGLETQYPYALAAFPPDGCREPRPDDDEPPGAGADPFGRPDPSTHPEFWRE